MRKKTTWIEIALLLALLLIVASFYFRSIDSSVKDFLKADVNTDAKMTSKIVSLSYDSAGGNIVVVCEDGSIWYRCTTKGSFKEANSNNFIERKFDAESKSGHN